VIAIVVIGGTSLFGGEGAIWRTAICLLILAVIGNVTDSLGWNSNVQDVITGVIVIGAWHYPGMTVVECWYDY
jgi:ribose transport system permease protein